MRWRRGMTLEHLTALQRLLRSVVDARGAPAEAEREFQNPGRWSLIFPLQCWACVEPRMLEHPDLTRQEVP
jgi:hypothetical protein